MEVWTWTSNLNLSIDLAWSRQLRPNRHHYLGYPAEIQSTLYRKSWGFSGSWVSSQRGCWLGELGHRNKVTTTSALAAVVHKLVWLNRPRWNELSFFFLQVTSEKIYICTLYSLAHYNYNYNFKKNLYMGLEFAIRFDLLITQISGISKAFKTANIHFRFRLQLWEFSRLCISHRLISAEFQGMISSIEPSACMKIIKL